MDPINPSALQKDNISSKIRQKHIRKDSAKNRKDRV